MHIAAREGKIDIIKFLINEDCDINAVDRFGRTPIYEAILKRNKDICMELKKAGGKI